MKKFSIGIIRVVTLNKEENIALHGRIIEKYLPQLETKSYCIPAQVDGIYNQETKRKAIPKIVTLALKIAAKHDGIIISCAEDPAVDQLKEKLAIPVVGAGRPAASYSFNFGERVGVLGIEESYPPVYKKVLKGRLVMYKRPDLVNCTNDLKTKSGFDSLINTAKELKDMKLDVIALACTGMSTINVAPILEQRFNLPVIDAVKAAGLAIYERCSTTVEVLG